jgi:hypothetical protein
MNIDSKNWPQVLHIEWTMETPRDDSANRPDERDDGFWPSRDPNAAGYVMPENYDAAQESAEARMEAWGNDEWSYVGVVAVATAYVPIGGNSFRVMTLRSGGLWGIESDSEDYLREVYKEEKTALMGELTTLGEALNAGTFITI